MNGIQGATTLSCQHLRPCPGTCLSALPWHLSHSLSFSFLHSPYALRKLKLTVGNYFPITELKSYSFPPTFLPLPILKGPLLWVWTCLSCTFPVGLTSFISTGVLMSVVTGSLFTLKTLRTPRSCCLWGVHLLIFTILEVKTQKFKNTNFSQNSVKRDTGFFANLFSFCLNRRHLVSGVRVLSLLHCILVRTYPHRYAFR